MKRMRIAVIDDGVNIDILNKLVKFKYNHYTFVIQDKAVRPAETPNGSLNHGTLCVALLVEFLEANGIYKDIDILSLSICNNNKKDLDNFVDALEWCVENDFDMVLMSIGIFNLHNAKRFLSVIERAQHNRIVLVASTSNEWSITYPAAFQGVVGVRSGLFYDSGQNEFIMVNNNPQDGIEIVAKFTDSKVLEKINNNSDCTFAVTSSLVVPFVAAKICKIMIDNARVEKKYILKFFPRLNSSIYIDYTVFNSLGCEEGIPVIAVCCHTWKEDDAERVILMFEEELYACVCIKIGILKNLYEKNIFHVPSVEDFIEKRGYYKQLFKYNSLILFLLDKPLSLDQEKFFDSVITIEKFSPDLIKERILELE